MQTEFSHTTPLFKSLGLSNFEDLTIHSSHNHFDFTRSSRRILIIGSMGAGKTEFSARIWHDSQVALKKSTEFAKQTVCDQADRRKAFFIRSAIDAQRFSQYPEDALAYRNGYVRLGNQIAQIRSSFELEKIIAQNPDIGTWILDEASFYDERLAYYTRKLSEDRGLIFIFPTLILNFRNEIFNSTARLLLEIATDVIPLSAYCEHPNCMDNSFLSYRYYQINGNECPALYFDPLIVVGGDSVKDDPIEPNYATRCEKHHYLAGKEYTFLVLKPLGMDAAIGNIEPLKHELKLLQEEPEKSILAQYLGERDLFKEGEEVIKNTLLVPKIAEKALAYLYLEQNIISSEILHGLIRNLSLDLTYIQKVLNDNGRTI